MIPTRYINSFHSKYKVLESGCWEWQAGRFENSYGKFNKLSAQHDLSPYAHITSYIIHHGTIPEGLKVCHKCDHPWCVNPEHLFLGTHQDNMDDAVSKGRMYGWKRPSGEEHGRAKLTLAQVELIKVDTRSRRVIAQEYGVSLSRISKIKLGQSWNPKEAPGRKLSPEQEVEVKSSELTHQQLADKFNVCRATIAKIKKEG